MVRRVEIEAHARRRRRRREGRARRVRVRQFVDSGVRISRRRRHQARDREGGGRQQAHFRENFLCLRELGGLRCHNEDPL